MKRPFASATRDELFDLLYAAKVAGDSQAIDLVTQEIGKRCYFA